MFERVSRSWALARASWQVLRAERSLLVFPAIAAAAALVIVAAFALGAFGLWSVDGLEADGRPTPGAFLGAFALYVCLYGAMFFCQAALVGAALMRFDGGAPTVRDGLRIARSRLDALLGYALIAATVGLVLRVVQERVGFLGRIVACLLGAGWTMATFLVVPVLVSEDVGPVDAIRSSAGTLKRTWGENVAGRAGLGIVFVGAFLALGLGGAAAIAGAALLGSAWLVGVAIAVLVAALVTLALVQVALHGIYAAALYRYASNGAIAGFDGAALASAFTRRR